MSRILLLGGVTEALAIARTLGPGHIYSLADTGQAVDMPRTKRARYRRRLGPGHIYSLAGVGRVPTDLGCQVRVGGYGGAQGLAAFMRAENIKLLIDATHPYAARISANAATAAAIKLLIDATHPYAARISANAATAAAITGIECWALRRPAWRAQPADDWREVADWAELVRALQPFQRPLFTLGREPLQHLDRIPAHQFWTLRALDSYPGNDRCEIIGARGPFRWEDEHALFSSRQIDVLVSKNSGSAATEPKLQVARELGVPVLVLRRPLLPEVDRSFEHPSALLEQLHRGAW